MIIIDLMFGEIIPVPDEMDWGLVYNTAIARSPFTGTSQVVELPGAFWTANLEWSILSIRDAYILEAMLAQTHGGRGALRIAEPGYCGYEYTPIVSDPDQSGNILVTAGWPLSHQNIMYPGDRFSFVGSNGMDEMHIVTSVVSSDAAGYASIAFEPPIRSSPAQGASVEVKNPKVIMRPMERPGVFRSVKKYKTLRLSLEEVLFAWD